MVPFDSVRVGPFDISIIKLLGEDRDNNLGTFSETAMAISLREKYASQQQEAETLLHEIFHAIFKVMNLRGKDTEERLVSLMSIGMAMMIRDNPDFMKWLMESLQ